MNATLHIQRCEISAVFLSVAPGSFNVPTRRREKNKSMGAERTVEAEENSDARIPRGVARRERLLDAARDVFLEQGYAGASVNDVVARAGGSLATLYKQFGSKEGLFTAAMERHIETAWAVIEAGRRDRQAPEQVLFELGRRMLMLVFDPGVIRLMRGLAFEAERAPALGELFLVRGPDRTREALADYLSDQVEQGRLALEAPREAAGIFMGMLMGEWHINALLGRDLAIDEARCNARARHCAAIFLEGVRR
ncbi:MULTISPECIES: TetR/AcrR family transcriptional regulator [unclassified Halomonas]|uniref:TetR/AcrR family transcriptional regulator n=1 Tax=unclassified Halomonas TaxID=2609666 RepID=UPI0021E35CDE|nr:MULTISPECIES: TetR/AcrR family transcriptional regulator [unclassified Halomonas]UYF98602.1 TetR/AcrR family transcriptional regulator [Halomonas sp. GD1P12]WNL43615.1 TetR/AcrR family transcriptional regulator [Halomonas sp. PAMB 3264]